MGRAQSSASQQPIVTLADVEKAADIVKDAVLNTDFDPSRTLSEMLGCEIWLKFENLQFTASFKERGALNRLNALSAEQRAAGVIAMSAGNHAQGVAYHARRLGIAATIVMPQGTPFVKSRTRADMARPSSSRARRWKRPPPTLGTMAYATA